MKVYLIHFDRPLHHAMHYIGKAKYLGKRMQHHQNGSGARILQVCNERGIGYKIVRYWQVPDNKASIFERRLKNQKKSSKLCPVCNPDGYKNREKEWSK